MADDERVPPEPAGDRKGTSAGDDFHDPLAGIGGLPPARSALTLRALLATFGLIVCTVLAIGLYRAGAPDWMVVVLALLAVVAVFDLLVIARRKRRGEPG